MENEIICILGILAEEVIIDENSKNTSLINLIEQINLSRIPSIINKLTILHQLVRSPGVTENKFELSLSIRNNEKQILNGNLHVDFLDKKKFRSITNLVGLVIFEIGELIVELKYKNSIIHQIKIQIEYQNQPEINNPI